MTGILLAGCGKNSKIPLLDEDGIKTFLGVDSVSIKTHDPAEVSENGYTLKDKVSIVYKAPILDGMLDQAVGKEAEFMYKKDTGSWELKSLTLTSCEVDTTNIPGSSWKCDRLSSEQIKALFGDKVPSDGSGTVYIRFLKKMGMFSFNLTNPKNTDSERFFETVGTNVKIVFVGPSGTVESKASVTGGSVTNSGELKLDLETDANGTVTLPSAQMQYRSMSANMTKRQAMKQQVPRSIWTASLFSSSPQRALIRTVSGRPNAALRKATSLPPCRGKQSMAHPNT